MTGIKVPWRRGGGGRQEFLHIVLVYRPPRVPDSEDDQGNTRRLYSVLEGLPCNVVVVGDFNMPSIDWDRNWAAKSSEKGLVNLVEDKFWVQHVLEPTHEDGNRVEILEPLGNGDHNMLEIDLVGPLKNKDSQEEVPDWSKADLGQLKVAIENVFWDKEFEKMSGIQSMDKFYMVLDREVERFVPKKKRRKGNCSTH